MDRSHTDESRAFSWRRWTGGSYRRSVETLVGNCKSRARYARRFGFSEGERGHFWRVTWEFFRCRELEWLWCRIRFEDEALRSGWSLGAMVASGGEEDGRGGVTRGSGPRW